MSREIKFDFVFQHPKSKEVIISVAYTLDELLEVSLDEIEENTCQCECVPSGESNVIECGLSCDYYQEFELIAKRQYTGLKDKNGKEIYEGDIIKLAHDWDYVGGYSDEHRVFKKETPKYKHYHIRVVEWESGNHAHFVTNPQRCFLNTCWLIEVIGNIHQNPELLKGGDNNG